MSIASPRRTPLSSRRRLRFKAALAAIAVAVVPAFSGAALGAQIYTLMLVLAAVWALRTNEARNGRD